jgi:hypothetical protein
MEKRLEKFGIYEFSNTEYFYKPKDIKLIDNKISSGALIQIKTYEKDGIKYLFIYIKVDQEWLKAFEAAYKDGKLEGPVSTDVIIAKYNFQTIELTYNEEDPYPFELFYYSTYHDDSLKMLDELIELIVPLELDRKEAVELNGVPNSPAYSPFEALALLRDHLLKTVKDLSSFEEIEKTAVDYLEEQGEEFRAYVMADSDRRLDDYPEFWKEELSKHEIWNEVENFLFQNFPDDTIGLIDEFL